MEGEEGGESALFTAPMMNTTCTVVSSENIGIQNQRQITPYFYESCGVKKLRVLQNRLSLVSCVCTSGRPPVGCMLNPNRLPPPNFRQRLENSWLAEPGPFATMLYKVGANSNAPRGLFQSLRCLATRKITCFAGRFKNLNICGFLQIAKSKMGASVSREQTTAGGHSPTNNEAVSLPTDPRSPTKVRIAYR